MMDVITELTLALSLMFFIVAFLYASVGHGGASGYLAILSFLSIAPAPMSTTALMLNILVASIAFVTYLRARHFQWSLTWPFMVTSIPAAFIGGWLPMDPHVYGVILALVLFWAAGRLAFGEQIQEAPLNPFSNGMAMWIGAGIGFLSGMVGVGGGIFLSPILLLMHWGVPKTVAATSAIFIVVNAMAGLAGRFVNGNLVVGILWPFLIAALLGGIFGAYWGANQFSSPMLKRVLSVVLVIAGIKLLLQLA